MTAARRTQLVRLGVWITLATAAVLTTVLAARTETGIRRLATLIAPSNEPARGAKAPQLANRQFDQEAEQRRVTEAIRALAADRDRLMARIGSLERNLEDVTGSIPPAAASPKPPSPPASNMAVIAARRATRGIASCDSAKCSGVDAVARRLRASRDRHHACRHGIRRYQDRVRRRCRHEHVDRRPADALVQLEDKPARAV